MSDLNTHGFPWPTNTLLSEEKGAFDTFREQPIAKQMTWSESVLSGTWELLLKTPSRQTCKLCSFPRTSELPTVVQWNFFRVILKKCRSVELSFQ